MSNPRLVRARGRATATQAPDALQPTAVVVIPSTHVASVQRRPLPLRTGQRRGQTVARRGGRALFPCTASMSPVPATGHARRPKGRSPWPDHPSIDLLDDDLLGERYDPGSLRRGRAYADEDRVRPAQLPAGGDHGGLSRFGGAPPTRCTSTGAVHAPPSTSTTRAAAPSSVAPASTCVAVILTARRQGVPAPPVAAPSAPTGRPRGAVRSRISPRPMSTTRPGSASPCSWRCASRNPAGTRPASIPGSPSAPCVGASPASGVRTGGLMARYRLPVRLPARCRRPAAAERRLRALLPSSRAGSYYTDIQAVPLAQFGPDLWHQLERAVEGRRRAASASGPARSWSCPPDQARASIDLTADEARDRHGLDRLQPSTHEVLTVGGDDSGLLGNPPHGLLDDRRRPVAARPAHRTAASHPRPARHRRPDHRSGPRRRRAPRGLPADARSARGRRIL